MTVAVGVGVGMDVGFGLGMATVVGVSVGVGVGLGVGTVVAVGVRVGVDVSFGGGTALTVVVGVDVSLGEKEVGAGVCEGVLDEEHPADTRIAVAMMTRISCFIVCPFVKAAQRVCRKTLFLPSEPANPRDI